MKHLLIVFTLLLMAQTAKSSNGDVLCYDKIEVSITDAPRFSGTFEVIVTPHSTDFKFYYLTRKKKSGKTISGLTR